MKNDLIHSDESVEDLGRDGLSIIQKKDGFRFGTDAVLLSHFAAEARHRKIVDLCTGTGIVALLLSARTRAEKIDAVEVQEDIADMAERSVIMNALTDRIKIHCHNLKSSPELLGKTVYDAVTVNPPYMRADTALLNESGTKAVSRHEILCTLEDVIASASALLKPQGHMYMVHRPSRLADIICLMRKYKIEPKRLLTVAPRVGAAPNLILIDGGKNGGRELKILPTLYVYEADGGYTLGIKKIYGTI